MALKQWKKKFQYRYERSALSVLASQPIFLFSSDVC